MEYGEEPTATFWLKGLNPLRKTKSPFLCCHGNSSAALWMLCRRLPWSRAWERAFFPKEEEGCFWKRNPVSPSDSCRGWEWFPGLWAEGIFFFKHCPAGKRRAMAQGSLQMIMELGSLFKDKLTQEEWFPHLYWYSCTSPPVQDDWIPLIWRSKANQKGSRIRGDLGQE